MLSPDDARLLDLCYLQGHDALIDALGPTQSRAFLALPHIAEALDGLKALEQLAARARARLQRRAVYDALERNLKDAATSAERFHAAWSLLRATQVPWSTPDEAPRRRSRESPALNAHDSPHVPSAAPAFRITPSDPPQPANAEISRDSMARPCAVPGSNGTRPAHASPPSAGSSALAERAPSNQAGNPTSAPGPVTDEQLCPGTPSRPQARAELEIASTNSAMAPEWSSSPWRPEIDGGPDRSTRPVAALVAVAGEPTCRARDRP